LSHLCLCFQFLHLPFLLWDFCSLSLNGGFLVFIHHHA
jgi:hypothetical protein